MIKNVITIVLLNLFQLNIHANIWTDPKTNVNYEYFVGKNTAEVKAGQPGTGSELSKPGSPLAAGEISILSKILVNGKEYTVTTIGSDAFAYCDKLTSVTIPESVQSIEEGSFEGFAFGNCTNLKEVHLAEGLSTIGRAAFQGCKELSSIIIPSNIISIGELAFRGCNTLSIVISLIQNPFECSWNSFGGVERIATLKVPKGCVAKYKQTKAWNEFSNIVEIE